MRMRQNLIDAGINLGRKLLAQSRLLVIVISDGLFNFSSSTAWRSRSRSFLRIPEELADLSTIDEFFLPRFNSGHSAIGLLRPCPVDLRLLSAV